MLTATSEDREIFRALVQKLRMPGKLPDSLGEQLLAVGLSFLDTPYAAHTLERPGREGLVVNLRQLDCYTFVENAFVLTRLLRTGRTSWTDYRALLKATRYRQGRLAGYASRLHYFTDWLHDNKKKGLLQDITLSLEGEAWQKPFDFMTAHRDQYPALQDAVVYRRLLDVEANCSARTYHFVPKYRLPAFSKLIENGDCVAIVTACPGLDVAHVGLAIYHKKGLHFLHASPQAGKVVVSETTLYQYLRQKKTRLGIMVARAL